MRNKNDLISLEEPRALPEISEDQIHYVYSSSPTPYQTYPDDANYNDNKQIIVHDPKDFVSLLPLYNVVVDNLYESNDYHEEYEDCYLRQRVERTYAYEFPARSTTSTQPHQAPGAVAANPIDQLLQSMNNLILAMGNTTNQLWEAKVIKFPIFNGGDQDPLVWLNEFDERHTLGGEAEPVTFGPEMTKALKKAKAAEAAYSRRGPLSSYSLKRSYLSREGPGNEEIGKLKKAITEMAQNMKMLAQKQNENKKMAPSTSSNPPQKTPTQPRSIQSDILCWQCGGRGHIARECSTKGPSNNNNGGTKQNHHKNGQGSDNRTHWSYWNHPPQAFKYLKATSHEGEGTDEISSVDPSSNSVSLIFNNRIEAQDAIQQPIEVTYCEAAVEQYPIYLILDTGSSRSLVLHEFLKRIGKDINKLSTQNLVDVYEQRKHLLGVVEDLPIEINRIKIPINIEVTEAWDYTVIVGMDWLAKVKRKIDLKHGFLEYEWKDERNKIPITCWKKMAHVLGKPVPLDNKSKDEEVVNKEEADKYESNTAEEERSYIVQEDKDKLSIIEIKKDYVSIEGKEKEPDTRCCCEKQLTHTEDSCFECRELSVGMKTLECLVDDLNKELEIPKKT
ncbi:12926_t:CDS:2 [Dentiscutata heterogama]|uniref:12926_t:CDS:1 n=1 Tax=Dentiscutata heterogama TaxID=1316150 RepID=A0ACA9LLK0_9GLOM|nr:12926_t:CDS:2 [Dentiscutata heterogama]